MMILRSSNEQEDRIAGKKKQYSIEALLKLVHLKYIFVSTPIVYEKKKKKGKGQKKKNGGGLKPSNQFGCNAEKLK